MCLQAEVLDSIQLKGEEKKLQVSGSSTSAKPHHLHSNRQPIPLDPAKASEYVRAVEAQRADYRQLLLYGPVRPSIHRSAKAEVEWPSIGQGYETQAQNIASWMIMDPGYIWV